MRNLFSTRVKIILVVAALLTAALAILSGITAQRSAISKYTWCRRYENKEY